MIWGTPVWETFICSNLKFHHDPWKSLGNLYRKDMGRWVSFFPECRAKGSRLTVEVWGPGVCSLAVSACNRARALWQGRWGRGGGEGGWVRTGGGRGHSGSRICLVCGVHGDHGWDPWTPKSKENKDCCNSEYVREDYPLAERLVSRCLGELPKPKMPKKKWGNEVWLTQSCQALPKTSKDLQSSSKWNNICRHLWLMIIYGLWMFMVGLPHWGEGRCSKQAFPELSCVLWSFLDCGGWDPVPRDVSGKSSRSSRYTPCYGAGLASLYLFGMLSMDI